MSADNDARVRDWTEGEAQLLVRVCQSCRRRWYFKRSRCPGCGSADIAASTAQGLGRVRAATTIHRAPTGTAVGDVPFGIALVDLDEGIRVMGRCDVDTQPGDRVAVLFDDEDDDKPLVPFFTRHGQTP